MEKALIKVDRLKPVLVYKKKCPYCRTQFPTRQKSRVTCGAYPCRYRHNMFAVAEYNKTEHGRGKIREYMRNRYYGLIMLKELERLAFK